MKRIYIIIIIFISGSGVGLAQEFKQLFELGHVGQNVLQFNNPRLMAVDNSRGRIYVANSQHNRVVAIDNSGNVIGSFGSGAFGSAAGQFREPFAVAVASDGSFYVVDQFNSRIQKFASDGTYTSQFSTGSSSIRGIAINTTSGDVYVTDNHRVSRYSSTGTLLNSWGTTTSGSATSQFSTPYGIAVDGSGNVYVADQNNHRIQKFTSTGTFLLTWGTSGTADGQLNSPTGIAVDAANQVYVCDYSNARVQIFTSSGAFVSKFGSYGRTDGLFDSPRGIAVDGSGNIYVSDEFVDRVQKFNSAGVFQAAYGKPTANGLFNNPRDVAFDANGNLFVVDTENTRIQKFDSNGSYVTQFGSYGSADGQFYSPNGIGIDPGGNVYVTDASNYRVQKFDNNGTFLLKFGSFGAAAGQFNVPMDVDVDASGNIYVIESSNNRVQKFSSTGTFVAQWGAAGSGDGQFSSARSITVDNNGDILVVDGGNSRVQKFSNTGTFLQKFGSNVSTSVDYLSIPMGIAVDASNNIFVGDQNNNRVKKVSATGTVLTTIGSVGTGVMEFYNPYGVSVYGDKIAVSDRWDRVQIAYPLATEPTAQSPTITFSQVESSSFSVSVAAASGNPSGYVVLRKRSGDPAALPADATTYTIGQQVDDATVVYNGPAGSFLQDGLAAGATYHYAVYAYNGTNEFTNYRLGFPLKGNVTTLASPFTILKEINETYVEQSGGPSAISDLNGTLIFLADDGTHGSELWKSNGVEAGTLLIKDIRPGSLSSQATRMAVLNSEMILVANDGNTGLELFKTDGTSGGTQLLKEILPGNASGVISSANTTLNGEMYFIANDGVHGSELWKTNGTTNGTVMVKDIVAGTGSAFPGSTFLPITFNNAIYFFAYTPAQGWELWKSDGTSSGTVLVDDLYAGVEGSVSGPVTIIANASAIYFVAYDGTSSGLWRSTGNGSSQFVSADVLSIPRVVGNTLYFISPGSTLMKSDGTAAGTEVIKSFVQAFGNSLFEVNGTLYFPANETGVMGTELWKSDGTLAGTTLVKDIVAGSGSGLLTFTVGLGYNNVFYFASASIVGTGSELWRSDGTAAGTYMLADINSGSSSSSPSTFTVVGGFLYFTAATTIGRELYKTDGTTVTLVKNINSQYATSSGISTIKPIVVNDEMFFVGLTTTTPQLWKTNGTEAGTTLVTSPSTSFTTISRFLGELNGNLLFSANDGTSGTELWKTNGTAAGTARVKDINTGTSSGFSAGLFNQYAIMNGFLYFIGTDGSSGIELWRSDGTEANTTRVRDINPGTSSSSPIGLSKVTISGSDVLFFLANDGTNGIQLWKSDGTSVNTERITNEAGGLTTTLTSQLLYGAAGGLYYFVVSQPDGLSGVWRSDGSAAGTFKVTELSAISHLAVLGNKIIITKASTSQLWVTDGTIAGTLKLSDFNSISGLNFPEAYTVIGNYFYFVASQDGSGLELWRTDGTPAGTSLFKEFNPGPGGGIGGLPSPVGNNFYLAAIESSGKSTMWASDGTTCGTYKLTDDPILSNFYSTRIGDKLILFNVTSANGLELFTIDLTQTPPPQPTAINAQPNGATACVGSPLNLQVTASGSNLSYQWKKDGSNINGATSADYSVPSYAAANAGSYTVDVTGTCGTVSSSPAVISTGVVTLITTHPVDTPICPGQALTLQVTAVGTNMTYEWKRNSVTIPGTSATLTIPNAQAANAGTYQVVVVGVCGAEASQEADVVVAATPQITQHPSRVFMDDDAANITLAVVASNATGYQWKKDNTNIVGATSATFSKNGATSADAGDYTVVVSGACAASVTSNIAKVSIFEVTKGETSLSFGGFGSKQSDYQMVSIPFTNSMTVASVFEDDLGKSDKTNWRIYHYNGTTTPELGSSSPISIGKGYWLLVKSQKEISAAGDISLGDPHIINLVDGWNQIGNPFPVDVSWADIAAANPTFTNNLKTFTGSGWTNGSTLDAFGGGFIFSDGAFNLNIPRGNFVGGRKKQTDRNPLDDEIWQVTLSIRHGQTHSDLGGIGMSPNAKDNVFDGLDELNLPRFTNYIEVVHPFTYRGFTVSKSIAPTGAERVWEFNLTSNQNAENAEIRWDNSYFGENDRQLLLVDQENSMVINMREASSYTFAITQNHRFKIVFGGERFVTQESLPEQNNVVVHPNPFRDQMTIQYALAQQANIQIDLLDSHSRPVRAVLSQVQDKGIHSVTLGEEMNALSSGFYFVRLKINDKNIYKKIIKH